MGFHSSPGGTRESNALLLRMRLTGIQAVCTFAKWGSVCDLRSWKHKLQFFKRQENPIKHMFYLPKGKLFQKLVFNATPRIKSKSQQDDLPETVIR